RRDLSELVRPHRERDEVRGDLRCLAEDRPRLSVVRGFLGRNWHVRDGGVARRMDQLDAEAGLELGLVEAGERAARVGGLELRRRVTLLAAQRAVEPAERFADPARP